MCARIRELHRLDPSKRRAYDRSEQRKARRRERLRLKRATDREWADRVDAVRDQRRQVKSYGITLDTLFEKDQGKCHICEQQVERPEAEMDHVIPLSRGGPSEPSNMALAHRHCNRRKSNRLDWEDLRPVRP